MTPARERGARPLALLSPGPQPVALPERSVTSLDVVHCCDALALLRALPTGSVNCVVTSPPYFGLRDYGVAGQIGLEATPTAFVAKMVDLFREVRRVLRDDGTCWVNMGDSYVGGGGYSPNAPSNQTSLAGRRGYVCQD